VTSQKDQIQALITEIDGALRKASPRLPWVVSGDATQQRRILERVRTYLIALQQQAADPSDLARTQQQLLAHDIQYQPPTAAREEGAPLPRPEISGSGDAQQVLQSMVQEMNLLRSGVMQTLQTDLEILRQQRDNLARDIQQLESQRQTYSLAQQQINQQQLINDFLQSLMGRVQESLAQQVSQSIANLEQQSFRYGSGLPVEGLEGGALPLEPAQRLEQLRSLQVQSDQLLMSLDSTISVVFEAIQRNLQAYQDSLSQGLDRMHGLGQQGEVMFTALINHLAQRLGQEASSYFQASLQMPSLEESGPPSLSVGSLLGPLGTEAEQPFSPNEPLLDLLDEEETEEPPAGLGVGFPYPGTELTQELGQMSPEAAENLLANLLLGEESEAIAPPIEVAEPVGLGDDGGLSAAIEAVDLESEPILPLESAAFESPLYQVDEFEQNALDWSAPADDATVIEPLLPEEETDVNLDSALELLERLSGELQEPFAPEPLDWEETPSPAAELAAPEAPEGPQVPETPAAAEELPPEDLTSQYEELDEFYQSLFGQTELTALDEPTSAPEAIAFPGESTLPEVTLPEQSEILAASALTDDRAAIAPSVEEVLFEGFEVPEEPSSPPPIEEEAIASPTLDAFLFGEELTPSQSARASTPPIADGLELLEPAAEATPPEEAIDAVATLGELIDETPWEGSPAAPSPESSEEDYIPAAPTENLLISEADLREGRSPEIQIDEDVLLQLDADLSSLESLEGEAQLEAGLLDLDETGMSLADLPPAPPEKAAPGPAPSEPLLEDLMDWGLEEELLPEPDIDVEPMAIEVPDLLDPFPETDGEPPEPPASLEVLEDLFTGFVEPAPLEVPTLDVPTDDGLPEVPESIETVSEADLLESTEPLLDEDLFLGSEAPSVLEGDLFTGFGESAETPEVAPAAEEPLPPEPSEETTTASRLLGSDLFGTFAAAPEETASEANALTLENLDTLFGDLPPVFGESSEANPVPELDSAESFILEDAFGGFGEDETILLDSDSSEKKNLVEAQTPQAPMLPVPAAPPDLESQHTWYLGLDIGTTGLSAVLLHRPTGELYPIYWYEPRNADEPEVTAPCFRLPAIAFLEDQQPERQNPLTSPLVVATAALASLRESADRGSLLTGLKPLLSVGVPFYASTATWEPVLQWSSEQTLPLVWVRRSLQDLLATLTQPGDRCVAVGLDPDRFQTAIAHLDGIIVGDSASASDTYAFNVREAILQAGLVAHPARVFFVEDAIATVLSGLRGTLEQALSIPGIPSQKRTLFNTDWRGATLVIDAGAATTEMALITLPSNGQPLAHQDFTCRSFPGAGTLLDQDIVCQLLLPEWARQPHTPDAPAEGSLALLPDWDWQSTFPATEPLPWESLNLNDLDLPIPGDPDPIARQHLSQRLKGSSLGQALLDVAQHLKLILRHQDRFTFELGNQQWVVLRRDLEKLVFLPYIQRLNRELNALLSRTGIAVQAVNQAVCTGGTATIPAIARWLQQKLPNATIIQDTYASEPFPPCSRVAYGLAAVPLHPQVLNGMRQQYSDYFLLRELLRVVPQQSFSVGSILQLLERQGINTQACQNRILSLLEGNLPLGLVPTEGLEPLATASAQHPDLASLATAPLFEKDSQGYRPNLEQCRQLQQYLETLLVASVQKLEDPLTANLTVPRGR